MSIPSETRSYWSISYWYTGAGPGTGSWVSDTKIPRAGLDSFIRTDEANINFIELADGNLAKVSSERKYNWGELVLTFPRQVINETVKTQLISYITNDWGIKIAVPILTGASSYTEKVLMGYPTKYEETWELTNDAQQKFLVKLTMMEFSVDGT